MTRASKSRERLAQRKSWDSCFFVVVVVVFILFLFHERNPAGSFSDRLTLGGMRWAIALNDYFFGEISSIFIGEWIQRTEENRDYINTIKIIEFLVAQ